MASSYRAEMIRRLKQAGTWRRLTDEQREACSNPEVPDDFIRQMLVMMDEQEIEMITNPDYVQEMAREYGIDFFGNQLPMEKLWQKSKAEGESAPPEPDVEMAFSGDELTPARIKGILMNPIYAGLGYYPALIDDATWVRSVKKMIEEEDSLDQVLVNLLYLLRRSFDTSEAHEMEDGKEPEQPQDPCDLE